MLDFFFLSAVFKSEVVPLAIGVSLHTETLVTTNVLLLSCRLWSGAESNPSAQRAWSESRSHTGAAASFSGIKENIEEKKTCFFHKLSAVL